MENANKRLMLQMVGYYSDTTGKDSGEFLNDMVSDDITNYSVWLAKAIVVVLNQEGISNAEILQYKDTIRAVKDNGGKFEGEFYTPEIWCKKGRAYLEDMLGDLWGKAVVWDASCGSGNLMRTSGYPKDKLFLSTLLETDVPLVKNAFPDATVFQCDFLEGIDYDSENEFFSQKLPPNLIEAFKNDEPIVFFMNPPYFQTKTTSTDVGEYMVTHGMSGAARDLVYQFFYRVLMLKRYYGLSKVFIGFYHPITLMVSEVIRPLVQELCKEFRFKGGMVFDAANFDRAGKSVAWAIAFTLWSSVEPQVQQKRFALDACLLNEKKDEVKCIGTRVCHIVEEPLTDWLPLSPDTRYIMLPSCTGANLDSIGERCIRTPENYLCWTSATASLRGGNRQGHWAMTLPYEGGVCITTENFWHCIPLFVTAILDKSGSALLSRQTMQIPDTTREGYEQWVIDCIPLLLFSLKSMYLSYRDLNFNGTVFNICNRMFPISYDIVSSVVTDERVREDLEHFRGENEFIVGVLDSVKDRFSKEARELYDFCIEVIMESLKGDVRKEDGYVMGTHAWDVGIRQLRCMPKFWTVERERRYLELWRNLGDFVKNGRYDFGVLDSLVKEE